MPLRIDSTELCCKFCSRSGRTVPLVRSMNGLYCTNERCYSRLADGNLVPPADCSRCKENAFYAEEDGTPLYICIACGQKDSA